MNVGTPDRPAHTDAWCFCRCHWARHANMSAADLTEWEGDGNGVLRDDPIGAVTCCVRCQDLHPTLPT